MHTFRKIDHISNFMCELFKKICWAWLVANTEWFIRIIIIVVTDLLAFCMSEGIIRLFGERWRFLSLGFTQFCYFYSAVVHKYLMRCYVVASSQHG